MKLKPINLTNLPKRHDYLVSCPDGQRIVKTAETSFHAIALCVEQQGYKYSNSQYKSKKIKQ